MAKQTHKSINLALQGGGSHGAFTWGVLDRLLEDERLDICAITGASAGAMNAVIVAEGMRKGGRDGARAGLSAFWTRVSDAARFGPFRRSAYAKAVGDWGLDTSPGYLWFDFFTRLASPYQTNPLGLNPLRDILADMVDFEAVRTCSDLQVFVSATNVHSGRAKVFDQSELTADHVMASACLPTLYKAVEIGGEAYWDGGYMGNPPLWPLFDNSPSDDVVIVQINPMYQAEIPTNAPDIIDRLNEITFNASLMRELRTVDFVTRLIDAGRLEGTGYRRVLTHLIADDETMAPLGASSKLNAEPALLDMLFEKGRAAANRWLEANFDAIGNTASVDLRALFDGDADALDGDRLTQPAKYDTSSE